MKPIFLFYLVALAHCASIATKAEAETTAEPETTTILFGYVKTKPENITLPTLVVDILRVDPFTMVKRICQFGRNTLAECEGNNKYEGYAIDLLKRLASKAGFEYELTERSITGRKNADGSWTGTIGDVATGKADLAIGSIAITEERQNAVDFSHPFMTTGISIMMKKPEKQEFDAFSFTKPFSTDTWIAIFVAYVSVSLIVFFVSRYTHVRSHGPNSYDINLLTCFWFPLKGIDSRSTAARLASCIWWFFAIVVICCYTANMTVNLLSQNIIEKSKPIESIDDLVKQTTVKYGILGGGSTEAFFKNTKIDTYHRAWENMQLQEPSVIVESYRQGIDRVRESSGNYAFLLESTANEYESERKPCDTMKIGEDLNSISYAVVLPFGSKWTDPINNAIVQLEQFGELNKLKQKWWVDRGECDSGRKTMSIYSLNLSQMQSIFYILLVGMFVAMIFAIAEHQYHTRKDKEQAKAINSLEKIDLNEEIMMDEELAEEDSVNETNENEEQLGLNYPSEV